MKTFNKKLFVPALIMVLVVFMGCDKTKPYETVIPPAFVHFNTGSTGMVKVDDQNVAPPPLIIGVGATTVADIDRLVSFNVTSPNGLVAGREYMVSPSDKLTIPAGKTTVDMTLNIDPSYFAPGVRDTLIFTLLPISSDLPVAEFNQTRTIVISGPCDDAEVDLSVMGGTYDHVSDADGNYGGVVITGLTETSPTTGKGMISNLWASVVGADPVEINFDWTDPNDIIVTIPLQDMGFDYDDGMPMMIRTSPVVKSTFSVCNQTISLVVDIIVMNYSGPGTGAYYEKEYPINVSR